MSLKRTAIIMLCAGFLLTGCTPEVSPTAPAQSAGTTDAVTAAPTQAVTHAPNATNVQTVEISCPASYFVYTEEEECSLVFTADTIPDGSVTVQVELTEFSSESIKQHTAVIEKGETAATLNLGRYPAGCYAVKYTPSVGKAGKTAYLTVLKSKDRQQTGDVFGVDLASLWHANTNEREEYIRLIKMMGVSNVRERLSLTDICKLDGTASLTKYKKGITALNEAGFELSFAFHDFPSKIAKNDYAKLSLLLTSTAKELDELIDGRFAVEIWNEQDVIFFHADYPDRFAAFTKACAIGLENSGADVLKLLGAYARAPQYSLFGDWMMDNNVMDYLDVYNFHVYTFTSAGRPPMTDMITTAEHVANADKYGVPAWQTEAGTIYPNGVVENRTRDSLNQQAGFVVQNVIQSAANGTERTYEYLFLAYKGGDDSSFLSQYGYAYPAYSAYSTATYMLGECEMLGKKTDGKLESYLVRRDDNTQTGVFWCNGMFKTVTLKSDTPVTVVGMTGEETTVQPENGVVSFKVGANPCYVSAPDGKAWEYFEDFSVKHQEAAIREIADDKKVFMSVSFPEANAPDMPTLDNVKGNYEGVASGYRFNKGETAAVELYVANLSDSDRTVSVSAKLPDGWKVKEKAQNVSVKAGETASLTFTLTAPSAASDLGDAVFTGSFDGTETVCISRVTVK